MTRASADEHLLPVRNATELETVFAASAARLNRIPVPIDLLKRPFEVPAQFLPHLAWEVSLDVWDVSWPEWRKRRAISRSIALHRIKGTLASIEGWLDLLGATVQVAIIPPIGGYLAEDRSDAERAAFVAQFAELRIYTSAEPGMADADLHLGDGFLDTDFVTLSTAAERYGQRAAMVDGGTVTPLTLLPVTWAGADAINADLSGIVIPGEDDGGLFLGDASLDETFAMAAKITSTLLTIAADRSFIPLSPQPVVIGEGHPLSLLSVTPERVSTIGSAGFDLLFVDDGFIDDAVEDKDLALRIFDRFHLYDPDRVVGGAGSDGGFFLDATRLEIPPFYSELVVNWPEAITDAVFGADDGFLDEASLFPTSGRIDRAARAIVAGKSKRSTIMFTTAAYRPLTLEDGIPLDGSAGPGSLTLVTT